MKIVITLVFLSTVVIIAQQNYELTPGVKGNQIVLQLSNISESQSAENVEVKLVKQSPNLEFGIVEAKVKNLNISEEKEAKFSFDVNYTADIAEADTIEFLITDNKTIQVTKRFIFTYAQPKEFRLEQNYPNPFNPSTTIQYQLPIDSKVTLKVYDILGAEVTTLVNEVQQAGYKQVQFSAKGGSASSAAGGLSSGVYVYRLVAGNYVSTKKMMVIK